MKSRKFSAAIRSRLFCLPICYLKIQKLKYTGMWLGMLLDYGCYIRPVALGWYRWLRMRDCRLPLYLTLSNVPEERRSHWLSMFGNGLSGNIIQPKTVELTMHNEKLNDLYASPYVTLWFARLTICYFMVCTLHRMLLYDLHASPYVTRVIKPRWMRWAGHVARVEERRCAYRVLVGTPEGKDLDVDGRVILKEIFEK